MRLRAGTLVVLASLAATASATADSIDALSPADRTTLISTAVKLRESILHVDLKNIAGLVRGMRCTDTQYDQAKIHGYLTNKYSILYQSLFDAPGFSARCGSAYPGQYPAASEKAFFETNPNGAIHVKTAQGDYAVVEFTSPKTGFYPREYTFKKEGRNWMLADGWVIGRCNCG